jgi:hypothetical protein
MAGTAPLHRCAPSHYEPAHEKGKLAGLNEIAMNSLRAAEKWNRDPVHATYSSASISSDSHPKKVPYDEQVWF